MPHMVACHGKKGEILADFKRSITESHEFTNENINNDMDRNFCNANDAHQVYQCQREVLFV